MKQVEHKRHTPENFKVRKFKLAARNMANKITGQDPLIEEYNSLMQTMAHASDAMRSVSRYKQKKILDAIQKIQGGEWVSDGIAAWEEGTFNPYKPFQKNTLRKKISAMRIAMKELGIQR